MRRIEYASQFKRDYRTVKRNPRFRKLDELLAPIVTDLVNDVPLSDSPMRDHRLSGLWSGYHELHVKPDLLLVYSKPDRRTLRLVRLGSHSDLFG